MLKITVAIFVQRDKRILTLTKADIFTLVGGAAEKAGLHSGDKIIKVSSVLFFYLLFLVITSLYQSCY